MLPEIGIKCLLFKESASWDAVGITRLASGEFLEIRIKNFCTEYLLYKVSLYIQHEKQRSGMEVT